MTFQYDSTGVNMDSNFSVVPEGIYNLQIVDVKEKVTKNGDPMVAARCEVINSKEHNGSVIWHNVTFLAKTSKGAGMAVHFLKTIGEPFEGKFVVEPNNWLLKNFTAQVRVGKDLNNKSRNEIAYILSKEEEKTTEEVPF